MRTLCFKIGLGIAGYAIMPIDDAVVSGIDGGLAYTRGELAMKFDAEVTPAGERKTLVM
jgi:hypothetical protein